LNAVDEGGAVGVVDAVGEGSVLVGDVLVDTDVVVLVVLVVLVVACVDQRCWNLDVNLSMLELLPNHAAWVA